MKENLKVALEALDIIFIPGGFHRFVKNEDKYDEEHYNIKTKLEDKLVKNILVPAVETLKVVAYASAAYGFYESFLK